MNNYCLLYNVRALCFVLALVLSGCGGGDDSSPPAISPPPTGGIEGSGIAIGTITGFGSIIVNGVRFDTSAASIIVEDQAATESALAVGQVVTISGSFDDGGVSGTATEVRYDDLLEGPVDSIDPASSSLQVLGQLVLIDADTSFDDGILPSGLDGLAVGDVVEVSGFLDASGSIRATRIERDGDGDDFELEGVVANHDGSTMTFEINLLTVDYSAATLEGFPGGQPENGQMVEVHGRSFGGAGELLASRLEFEDGLLGAQENDEVEIEGLITRFASATDFDVAGLPVATTGQTIFLNGTQADLALNRKVEAEGTVDASGILVASTIDFRRAATVEIQAVADSVDADSGTVVMLGITISVDAATRFEDDSDASIERFSLADVNPGDFLEVRGAEEPPGSDQVFATRLERDEADAEVRLQGVVDDVLLPDDFVILGVTIHTAATTVFRDRDDTVITGPQFFAAADGRLVKTKGTWDGSTINATEVGFED